MWSLTFKPAFLVGLNIYIALHQQVQTHLNHFDKKAEADTPAFCYDHSIRVPPGVAPPSSITTDNPACQKPKQISKKCGNSIKMKA